MMDLDLPHLLTMYEMIYEKLVETGMSPEQAFDEIAKRAAHPEVQAAVGQLRVLPRGRAILMQVQAYWDIKGLPVPWDNVMELPNKDSASNR